jgi:hypothetical protein
MPRDQHYHQAGQILTHVLGADAADEQQAYRESIEQIAKLFEIAEAYQDRVSGTRGSGAPAAADINKNRAA